MKIIRFRKHHAPYNAGEIAGMTEGKAQALVETGVAEYAQRESHPAETATPSESEPARPSSYRDKQSRPRRR